jgi:hypothetical protein
MAIDEVAAEFCHRPLVAGGYDLTLRSRARADARILCKETARGRRPRTTAKQTRFTRRQIRALIPPKSNDWSENA